MFTETSGTYHLILKNETATDEKRQMTVTFPTLIRKEISKHLYNHFGYTQHTVVRP